MAPKAGRAARTRATAPDPATDGGRTIGRSTTASSQPLPRNCRRARTNASGRPSDTVITQADRGGDQAQPERIEDRGRRDGRRERPVEDRPHDERDDRQAKEEREEPGDDSERAVAPAARVARSGRGRSGAGRPRAAGLPATSSITRAAGTRSRPGSPGRSGPANQSRNALAAAAFAGRLDDDAVVGRRHVGRVGHVDRLDLVGGLRVGDVDDAGVALAEFDLGDDGLHVVLLRRDVGGVRRREVGRIAGLPGEVLDELRGVLRDRDLVAGRDDLDAGLRKVGGRRDPGRVVGRHDDRQLVAARR